MSTTTSIKRRIGRALSKKKKSQANQIGQEEVELSLFTDYMISYIKALKILVTTTTKILELINKFNKITGYKINALKNQLH